MSDLFNNKISPAIAWLTIQKFIIFYCPLDGEHTTDNPGAFIVLFWRRNMRGNNPAAEVVKIHLAQNRRSCQAKIFYFGA